MVTTVGLPYMHGISIPKQCFLTYSHLIAPFTQSNTTSFSFSSMRSFILTVPFCYTQIGLGTLHSVLWLAFVRFLLLLLHSDLCLLFRSVYSSVPFHLHLHFWFRLISRCLIVLASFLELEHSLLYFLSFQFLNLEDDPKFLVEIAFAPLSQRSAMLHDDFSVSKKSTIQMLPSQSHLTSSWYSYFFRYFVRLKILVLLDLPQ